MCGWVDVCCWVDVCGLLDVCCWVDITYVSLFSLVSRAEESPWQPISGEEGYWECTAGERIPSDRRKQSKTCPLL